MQNAGKDAKERYARSLGAWDRLRKFRRSESVKRADMRQRLRRMVVHRVLRGRLLRGRDVGKRRVVSHDSKLQLSGMHGDH